MLDKLKYISELLQKLSSVARFTLSISALLSVTLPLSAWIWSMHSIDMPVSILNIAAVHSKLPHLYIVNLVPLALFSFLFAFVIYYADKNENLQKEIELKQTKISQSAQLAKLIGEGNLASEIDGFDTDDVLIRSLLRMRANLQKTNEKETEQTWIASGREKILTILRLHNNLEDLAYETIQSLIEYINAVQGAFFFYDEDDKTLQNIATFAYNRKRIVSQKFRIGEGLIGQAAYEMATIYRTEIPETYVSISSGILGEQRPQSILIVPLISDDKLQGVLELASLESKIPELKLTFIEQLSSIIAQTVFNLKVNTRTEKLLQASQKMTEELKENEEELKQNAEEMQATHEELEKMNANLQSKIKEVENAQKKMHSLLENASEVISIYDRNEKLVYESPSVYNILGYSPEEMMAGMNTERLNSKGQKELSTMFEMLLENPEEPITIQYTYLRKDNQKIYIESTGRNLLDDPAIQGIIVNSQDVTTRKKAEQEERMKSKMQALSENSLDLIIRIGLNGTFFYLNPVFEKITGLPASEAINNNLADLELSDEIKKTYWSVIDTVKTTIQKTNTESNFVNADGENRIMSIAAIPEFSDDKELETILIVAHDITEQKAIENEISHKNKSITESINYAYRIQTAILPDDKVIRAALPKSFMFYKPRDVVSGDFPWFYKKDNDVFIAAVDCTGHGVPGALLSFVGYFLLNNIVDHNASLSAGKICDLLHAGVRKTLKQESDGANARDGMDIAFCKINMHDKKLQYAGAHRPLYLVRGDELIEYKGNRKAIGGIPHMKKVEQDFENYEIDLLEGDKFFFFSDGFPDQVGGEDKRKYQAKQMRELIMEHKDYTMPAFQALFKKEFNRWIGDENKQIDDVLLIGIEI
jgi:PAS domain S-box-containing protein